jgi:hypothetical protein
MGELPPDFGFGWGKSSDIFAALPDRPPNSQIALKISLPLRGADFHWGDLPTH